jgi:hypothetical protein
VLERAGIGAAATVRSKIVLDITDTRWISGDALEGEIEGAVKDP